MKHSQRILKWGGIYGLIVLLPQYFMEHRIGVDTPPPITHPEYFYGFIGVATAWQIAFLIMSGDPVRYRFLLIPAALEKAGFGIAALVLHQSRGVPPLIFVGGLVDLLFVALFFFAYLECRRYEQIWG